MTSNQDLANAIRESLISPNVSDSNGECANLVDVIASVSRSVEEGLDGLALATGERFDERPLLNTIDLHANVVKAGLRLVSEAIYDLADAVRTSATASEK